MAPRGGGGGIFGDGEDPRGGGQSLIINETRTTSGAQEEDPRQEEQERGYGEEEEEGFPAHEAKKMYALVTHLDMNLINTEIIKGIPTINLSNLSHEHRESTQSTTPNKGKLEEKTKKMMK